MTAVITELYQLEYVTRSQHIKIKVKLIDSLLFFITVLFNLESG